MRLMLTAVLILSVMTAHARVKLTDPIVITDTLSSSASIKPDSMASGMTVQYLNPDYQAVSVVMENISASVKANSQICVFSGYQISPEYRYDNGNSTMNGYRGSLDFSCSFSDIKKYEAVVNAINDATQDKGFAVTSRPVSWTVSKQALDKARTALKTKTLKDIFATAREYSKAVQRQCFVKDITLDYSENFPVYRESSVRMAKAAAPLTVAEPDKTDQTVTVTAKYSFACK